jgi:hypothetical protein
MSREDRRERREERHRHNDPGPRDDPDEEPEDNHQTIPLDDDEDGRWLDSNDPRRLEAEHRRGRPFDDDEAEEESNGSTA